MHITDLCEKIEGILRKRVKGKYPISWDEDHITYSIFEEFCNSLRCVEVCDETSLLHDD